jgi:hypothetical protein
MAIFSMSRAASAQERGKPAERARGVSKNQRSHARAI